MMELHQLGSKIKFILVGQGIRSVRLAKFRIFENVNDLRNNDELYREVTRTCRLSLQSRKETTLEELITRGKIFNRTSNRESSTILYKQKSFFQS
jgi:hypothetical protein